MSPLRDHNLFFTNRGADSRRLRPATPGRSEPLIKSLSELNRNIFPSAWLRSLPRSSWLRCNEMSPGCSCISNPQMKVSPAPISGLAPALSSQEVTTPTCIAPCGSFKSSSRVHPRCHALLDSTTLFKIEHCARISSYDVGFILFRSGFGVAIAATVIEKECQTVSYSATQFFWKINVCCICTKPDFREIITFLH